MFKLTKKQTKKDLMTNDILKNISVRYVVLLILFIFLLWFFIFRTKELMITYDSVETTINSTYNAAPMAMKSLARTSASYDMALGASNMLSESALYDEGAYEEEVEVNDERYRENKYYRVDTDNYDNLINGLTKDIEELKGVIKYNNQNSNRKIVYEKEFYPRLQNIEFTIDNAETDIERIEETLKKWGNIRISNSNKTSIEQELVNYTQQLKEMEEARKALQESKDRDWIARQDAELAKKSERIKNQIENAKKQSTYKTYNIDIYEVVKYRVNAIRYWYNNNYEVKTAVEKIIPLCVLIFAVGVPTVLLLTILLCVLSKTVLIGNFKKKMNIIEETIKKHKKGDIHFDIKM